MSSTMWIRCMCFAFIISMLLSSGVCFPCFCLQMRWACRGHACCFCKMCLQWKWSGGEWLVSSQVEPCLAWLSSAAEGERGGWRRTQCTSTMPPQSTHTPGTKTWKNYLKVTDLNLYAVWIVITKHIIFMWFCLFWNDNVLNYPEDF